MGKHQSPNRNLRCESAYTTHPIRARILRPIRFKCGHNYESTKTKFFAKKFGEKNSG